MAEQIVSPGVFTRENDQSFITQQPVQVGAAIVGPTVKGPVEIPTVVTSYSDYQNKFGTTFVSGNQTYSYLTSISAYNYFQNGGTTLLVTRVVSGAASWTSAISNNIFSRVPGPLSTTADALLTSVGSFTLSGSTLGEFTGVSASNANVTASITLDTTSSISTITITGQSGNFAVGDVITFRSQSFGAGSSGNTDMSFTLQANDITGNVPFVLKTISEGDINNSSGTENSAGVLTNGTIDNVRWEISQADTGSGTFTLLIRRGDDITNEKVILETYANVSLDPEQSNYVARVIGDTYQQIITNGDETYLETIGNYPNASRYVYVSTVNYPTPNYFNSDGTVKSAFTASIPLIGSGTFDSATGSLNIGGANFYDDINSLNTQGLTGAAYTTALNLLANKEEYSYKVITVPGLYYADYSSQLNTLITTVQNRGDAIAVVDLVAHGSTIVATTTEANRINNSYAAAYWPWVQILNPDTGKFNWVPASTLIPGVYAANDAAAEPWFAPAGINRGGLTQVIRPERKLQRSDRDTLYENNVNPIANFPATGPAVFGQKTLQKRASALDRVNVRRLLIELKSFIGQVANNLVFEQNTAATRNAFLAQVNPYLESVQQRQGVYAFRVVMDDSNNTPDVIDRNQLVGQIFIQPTRTAEFIVLDFNVLPTGAEFPA
jgi:phage tail sheath protein FI/polyisoprenoid-binding protein YceI